MNLFAWPNECLIDLNRLQEKLDGRESRELMDQPKIELELISLRKELTLQICSYFFPG